MHSVSYILLVYSTCGELRVGKPSGNAPTTSTSLSLGIWDSMVLLLGTPWNLGLTRGILCSFFVSVVRISRGPYSSSIVSFCLQAIKGTDLGSIWLHPSRGGIFKPQVISSNEHTKRRPPNHAETNIYRSLHHVCVRSHFASTTLDRHFAALVASLHGDSKSHYYYCCSTM